MKLSLLLLVSVVITFSPSSNGERWVDMYVGYSYTNGYDMGLDPIGRKFLRAKVKACSGVGIYLLDNENFENYVIWQLYYSYSYTALVYNGGFIDWDFVAILDCNSWAEFWFSWEGSVHSMGYGLEPGTNVYLTGELGQVFQPNILKVAMETDGTTGECSFLIDDPPLFVLPVPGGTEVADLGEDTALYSYLYSPYGTDPEGDALVYQTIPEIQTLFQVYDGHMYLMVNFDYETAAYHLVTYTMTDGRSVVKNTMLYRISNVIDVTPTITANTLSIPEGLSVGTDIGRAFTVVDTEDDDTVTYSISGSHSDYLAIDPSTGVISITQLMDVEATAFDLSTMTFTATDAGSNAASLTLAVTVFDVNDNAPVFSQEYYETDVDEGTSSGNILTLAVTDADVSNNGVTLSIISQDGASSGFAFAMNGFDVSVTSTLDYETMAAINYKHVLTVQAIDDPFTGNPLTSTTAVIIQINALNDNTPAWSSTPVGGSVPEDAAVMTVISTIAATDADLGEDGKITYAITSGNTDLFSVDSTTGEVMVGGHLDADLATGGTTSYTLTVSAIDHGATPKDVTADITITVTGVNDNAPIFDQNEYVVHDINEGETLTVLQPVVTDIDGDTVTLTLEAGNDDGVFSVDGQDIKVSGLDYETARSRSLVIRASDGLHTTDASLVIYVADVSDEDPVISLVTSTSMAEEQTIGTRVAGGFTYSDPDVDDVHTFSISGTGSAYLNIDSTNGELTVAQNVDYESGLTELEVTVTVTDQSSRTDSETFTISVEDINDNPPVFSPSVYNVQVTENTAADVSLLDLTCTDLDTSNAGFTASVSDGDGGTGSFKMVGLQLRTTSTAIDYDALSAMNFVFKLVVTAEDSPPQGPSNTGSALVIVTVVSENEFTPYWTSPANDGSGIFDGVDVSEGDPPCTVITTLQAADDDEGGGGRITYSITSITAASGSSSPGTFAIDEVTGDLTVAGPLDVDTATNGEASYTVAVRATDNGVTPKHFDGAIVVTLLNANDNPPNFDQTEYIADINEDSAIGDVVITLQVDDIDADPVTLTIEAGRSDLFECDGNDVKVIGELDFESDDVHVLVIRADDSVFQKDVSLQVNVIDVIDEPPEISIPVPSTMSEGQAPGTGVEGGYVVTDPDTGDTLTYALAGVDSSFLTIDPSTGELTIAQHVDREGDNAREVLDLDLIVTDSVGLESRKAFTITVEDINDLTPTCDPSEFTAEITENSAPDIKLLELTCSDGDDGLNAEFDLTVVSGDDGAGVFKMVGLELRTSSNPPDYEALGATGNMYTLVIHAVDKPTFGDANTGAAIIRVSIVPENEYTPVWTTSVDGSGYFDGATVSESDPPGTPISTVAATDDDLGDDGIVEYSVASITGASGATFTDLFSVDSSTGAVMVASDLDFDAGTGGESSFTVVIRASDKGTSPLYVDGSIVVTLTNVNDNPPTFDQTDYVATVSEASPVGTVALDINPADHDGDPITLSILSGDDTLFECDGTDVKLKALLDYETRTFHILTIRATDGVFESDVPLQILVEDASDEYPVITIVTTSTMSEEQPIGTGIYGGYLATDADAGDQILYSISGTHSAYVDIDSVTGQLFMAGHVDREGVNALNQLDLTLTVTDGVLSDSQDFNIAVADINDRPSIFDPTEYTAVVTENDASDIALVELVCTDDDLGNGGLFDLTVANGDGGADLFKMVGLQLMTSSSPSDYESVFSTGGIYTLVITAVDKPDNGPANTGTAIVKVTVNPLNEYSPVWIEPDMDGSGDFVSVSLDEDTAPGTLATTFEATDDDQGVDGDVTYSIESIVSDAGDSLPDLFTIDPSTGAMVVSGPMDAETVSHYIVEVKATDGGVSPNSVVGPITVALVNVNDNAPTFNADQYQVDVSEDSVVGAVVTTLVASDLDGDALTFTVHSGSALFQVNGNDLEVGAALDFETEVKHVVVVRVSDGVFETDVSIEITVMDVNDEDPVITVITTSPVAEEQAIGTYVESGVVVTDSDTNDDVTFSITGTGSGYFNILEEGQMTLSQNIDYESGVTSLDVTLTVTDAVGHTDSVELTFDVLDINDRPPVFDQTEYSIDIAENEAPGTSLLDLVVTDADSGNNAIFQLSVAQGDDDKKFQFVGQQLQTTNIPLDYETGSSYFLLIHAVDTPDQGGSNTGTAIVRVTVTPVNEHSPAWSAPDVNSPFPGVAVDENVVPGSIVTTFQATDDDKGVDGLVTYSLVSVTGDTTGSDVSSWFKVDSKTGQLIVAGQLDSDLATGGEVSYTLVVRASDSATTPNTQEGTIVVTPTNVNDNSPTFGLQEYEVSVDEDIPTGSVVITMDTEDFDGDVMTLSIVSGGDGLFEISGSDVNLISDLDFETKQYHVLFIRVSDGTFETDVSLRIDVNDVSDETPVITMATSTSLSEEQTIGTAVIGGYSVSDPDVDESFTFTLSGAHSSYLNIDATTGALTVAQNIDREGIDAITTLSLTLTVEDQAGLEAIRDFDITVEDINDNPPTFGLVEYSLEVTENTAIDTELLELTCTDNDVGNNAQFDVQIIDGDDVTPKFQISGLKLLTATNDLDYESMESVNYVYNLVITAVDTPDQGDALTGTTVVKVTVIPENEYDPVWTLPDSSGIFALTIAEDTSKGEVLTTFKATDNDIGADGHITYSIESVTAASGAAADDMFAIDSCNGELIVTRQPDFDSGTNGESSYTIAVKAMDYGTPSRIVQGTLTVTLTNINDNAPHFDQVNYESSVNEDSAIGDVIITLNVEDFDGDDVTLTIDSGRDDLFECSGNDVKVKDQLDFETEQFYVLILRASDGANDRFVPLHVTVNDVIDETPVITIVTTPSMSEEQIIGTPVYSGYTVYDADVDDILTYSLSGIDSGFLSIDSSTGELTVAQNIDRDGTNGKTSLSLSLTITDQAGLQATESFTINVLDVNDQPPTFSQRFYDVSLDENTPEDEALLELTCTDGDDGNNALFDVQLLNGDDTSPKFKIENSKLLTAANPTDYESLSDTGYRYVLLVVAVDTPDQGAAKTSTAVVQVRIKAVNDGTPQWTSPTHDGAGNFDGVTVDENVAFGSVVTTFKADDDDLTDDGSVEYSIVSVTGDSTGTSLTDLNLFYMNPSTGDLLVASELDADTATNGESSYTVAVRASDKGVTPSTIDGTIVVTPNNVNDNAPVFTLTEYESNVDEGSPIGTVVIDLDYLDNDGDTATLEVISGRDDLFEIVGNEVKVKGTLDYETETVYLLFIEVSDGEHSNVVSVKVDVNDLLDEAPIISMVTTSSMAEGQAIGTGVVGGYLATDADVADEISFALSGGDSHYFSINVTTGELTVAEHVDREGASGVTALSDLTLTVTDQAGLLATQSFTVTVVDVNDNTPICTPAEVSVDVAENTAHATQLVEFTCVDDDGGQNALYELAVGQGDDVTPKFEMDGLKLQTSLNPSDYETAKSYTLYITSIDNPSQGEPNTGTSVVMVTITPVDEHTPTWSEPANDGSGIFDPIVVNEDMAPGDEVTQFKAVDDDDGDDGLVTYSLVSVTGDTTGSDVTSLFSVDSESGQLVVAGQLDSDLATGGEVSYTLVIRASDSATTPNTLDGTVVITPTNVNDNAPTFDQNEYKSDTSEASSVGDVVATLGITDPDGASTTLSIVSGDEELFYTDGADVKVKAALDFETAEFHVLVLRVDDGVFQADVSLEITVNDVSDEAPVITFLQTMSMSEQQAIGTGVDGGYVVVDPDEGDIVTFSLGGSDSGYFSIDPNTGELTVAQVVDREGVDARTTLSLSLTATDQTGLSTTRDFTINVLDINDLPPLCDPPVFSTEVQENSAPDIEILDLTCADGDEGNNAVFTVSIGSGDDTDAKFKMDGKRLMTGDFALDYESLESVGFMYTLTVTAVDTPDQGSPNTGTAVVKVKVIPANEFEPVWTTSVPDGSGYLPAVTIDEDSSPGTPITTVGASDDDLSDDGIVGYEIASITLDDGSAAEEVFVVGFDNGELQVKSELDFETSATYDVSIRAIDGGTPSKEVTLNVIVNVNNVNDVPPEFSEDKYTVDVPESTAVNDVIFTLPATDVDGDALSFDVDPAEADLFQCSGADVILLKELDFEVMRYHSTQISVTDGIHTAYVSFVVNVVNVMDEPPSLTVHEITIEEALLIGTILGDAFTVDDADINDVFTFTLSGTNAHMLDIDSTTGALSVKEPVDYEDGITVLDQITLTVTDQGGQSDSVDLTFNVIDINDNAPVFSEPSYSATVEEAGSFIGSLLEFTVTDADASPNGDFSLTLLSGDDASDPAFSMVNSELHVDESKVDYDVLTDAGYVYVLTIAAIDQPSIGQPKTTVVLVTITVTPKDEFDPVWTEADGNNKLPEVSLSELTGIGSPVTSLTAFDGDAGRHGQLHYKIQSVTDNYGNITTGLFAVQSENNMIKVVLVRELDADERTGGVEYYSVVVTAEEIGDGPSTSTATVTINVEDENDITDTTIKPDAETWGLRAALMATGAGLGIASVFLMKKILTKLFKKPNIQIKSKMERHRAHDEEMTLQEVTEAERESIRPDRKFRPPRF